MTWTGILTIPVAIIQAIISCLLLLVVAIIGFRVGSGVGTFTSYLDGLSGMDVGAQISTGFGIVFTILLLVVVTNFAICVLLCRGVCENKPGMIVTYIIYGGILLAVRVSMITQEEYNNFPEDKAILHCALYGLYLVLLIINCVEINKKRKQQLGGFILSGPLCAPRPPTTQNLYTPV